MMNTAMDIIDENHVLLSDLGLVSALSLKFPCEITKQNGNKRAFFVFENSDSLQNAINDYWNSSYAVDAKKYSEQIKSIKSRLYQTL